GEGQLRRRRTGYIDKHCAASANVGVGIIEREPISRCPVISRIATENRSGLQPNNRFATAPITSSVEGVSGGREHISTVTSNTAVAPNSAANSARRPGGHTGRIINSHSDNPTAISAAIAGMARIRYIEDAINQRECGSLVLD